MSVAAEDHFLFGIGKAVKRFETLNIRFLIVPWAVGGEQYFADAVIADDSDNVFVGDVAEMSQSAEGTADVDIAVLTDEILFHLAEMLASAEMSEDEEGIIARNKAVHFV